MECEPCLGRGRTLGAMAHELSHAWQSDNAPLQDRKLKEGFARWVEYHVLMAEGHPDRARGLTMVADDDYGGGLRALLAIEAQGGTKAVLETARTRKSL